jgi:hypothetical protein
MYFYPIRLPVPKFATEPASVLAVIADNPTLSSSQKKRLIERLSALAHAIGEAMSREAKNGSRRGSEARIR